MTAPLGSMASATNNNSKPFHSYENVGYEDQLRANNIAYTSPLSPPATAPPQPLSLPSPSLPSSSANPAASSTLPATLANASLSSNGSPTQQTAQGATATTTTTTTTTTAIAVNKAAIESPFTDPQLSGGSDAITPCTAKVLSTTDSSGTTTRMLTSSASSARLNANGQNLVTRLITFPPQSPMDSLREWSLSTFKCTKQLINERRGLCPVTSDSQLANEVEQLRENRNKLVQMLRLGQQMVAHYGQLVRTQRQLHSLVNEMSIKCFTPGLAAQQGGPAATVATATTTATRAYKGSKQVVANFSSLSNNLSSSTQSPTRNHHQQQQQHHLHRNHNNHQTPSHANSSIPIEQHLEDFLPVLAHMKTFNDTNLVEDFKKNALTLNVAIRNGEKLIAALNFYCSNLSTLINKTIEDTLATVKHFELARLEYDAEKNSLSLLSSQQSSATYSSDKVELARLRYEQLREDVQIKLRFLEENTIKVMHKQLLLFNGAFASYTAGNTAALESTLKQFSIKD